MSKIKLMNFNQKLTLCDAHIHLARKTTMQEETRLVELLQKNLEIGKLLVSDGNYWQVIGKILQVFGKFGM